MGLQLAHNGVVCFESGHSNHADQKQEVSANEEFLHTLELVRVPGNLQNEWAALEGELLDEDEPLNEDTSRDVGEEEYTEPGSE